jgi:broad specificity phosphatase PhoE
MLLVVRHGRTRANASGLLLGRADPDLDEHGERQAEAIAAVLPPLDRVVASPLRRAQQTAATFGVPVETDDRWIELDYGDWDGEPIAAVPPDTWAQWRHDLDLRPPGGETLVELGRRVRAACDDLVGAARDGNVAVVTHVSPVKAAVAWALGVGDEVTWRMFVGTASITRIEVRDDRPVLTSFDEVGHLPHP